MMAGSGITISVAADEKTVAKKSSKLPVTTPSGGISL